MSFSKFGFSNGRWLWPSEVTGIEFLALSGGHLASEGTINGWTRNREQLGQVADGVLAGVMHAAQLFLLLVGKFGFFAAELASSSGDRHALAGAQPD